MLLLVFPGLTLITPIAIVDFSGHPLPIGVHLDRLPGPSSNGNVAGLVVGVSRSRYELATFGELAGGLELSEQVRSRSGFIVLG